MRFIRLLRVHLRQMLSWQLVLYGAGIAILQACSASGLVMVDTSVWYIVFLSMATGVSFFTLYIIPTLPYSMSLSLEWEEHAIPYWIIRTGVAPYTVSKLLTSAIAGFIAVFIGLVVFMGVAGAIFPIYTMAVSDYPYETLLAEGHLWIGLVCFVIHYSLSGALVAAFGLFVTVYIPSPYVAVASPLALYLTISRLTANLQFTGILDPSTWVGSIHVASTAGVTLLEKFLFTAFLIAIMCFAAVSKMRRRLRNA